MRRAGGYPLVWRSYLRAFVLLAVLPLVNGCTGDFGRVANPDALPPLHTGSIPASSFPLTDDEKELRNLARNLLSNPDEVGWVVTAVPGAQSSRASSERYVDYLVKGPFRSAAARYSKLVDDTRNDITRLEPFFMVARRIADLDLKRERSLPHVSRLTEAELLNAKRRVRENMMFIAEVHHVMIERAVMYRTALERLVIALPSPLAVEAERQRIELERRLAAIQLFAGAPPPDAPISLAPRPLVSK